VLIQLGFVPRPGFEPSAELATAVAVDRVDAARPHGQQRLRLYNSAHGKSRKLRNRVWLAAWLSG